MGASASREKFRESFEELIGEDISPDDAEFWDELWKIPSSAEEVFELISPSAARYLKNSIVFLSGPPALRNYILLIASVASE